MQCTHSICVQYIGILSIGFGELSTISRGRPTYSMPTLDGGPARLSRFKHPIYCFSKRFLAQNTSRKKGRGMPLDERGRKSTAKIAHEEQHTHIANNTCTYIHTVHIRYRYTLGALPLTARAYACIGDATVPVFHRRCYSRCFIYFIGAAVAILCPFRPLSI